MQTKPKSNTVVTSRIPEGTELISMTVQVPAFMLFEVRNPDGSILQDHLFDLSKVSAECMGQSCVHGWNQRIPDCAAISTTDKDGHIIPRAERTRIKSERINEVIVHYESGTAEWSRKGGGDGSGGRAIAVEAFALANDCTYDAAKERIERRAKAAGRTYAKQLAIVRELFPDEIAQVERERAAGRRPVVDADAELEALRAESEE